MSSETRPTTPPRRPRDSARGRLGARTYLIAAVFLFVLPAVVGGIAWLYGIKRDVDRAFTQPLREVAVATALGSYTAVSFDRLPAR